MCAVGTSHYQGDVCVLWVHHTTRVMCVCAVGTSHYQGMCVCVCVCVFRQVITIGNVAFIWVLTGKRSPLRYCHS